MRHKISLLQLVPPVWTQSNAAGSGIVMDEEESGIKNPSEKRNLVTTGGVEGVSLRKGDVP
jgi:hypothetical protein